MTYQRNKLTVGTARDGSPLASMRHTYCGADYRIGGPAEVRALIDDLECLHLNMDQSANKARRELSWELMQAAFEFGLIERDEADDSPKPKEFGGAKALASLLITELRRLRASSEVRWQVYLSNYFPREVESCWPNEDDAAQRAETLNASRGDGLSWNVERA